MTNPRTPQEKEVIDHWQRRLKELGYPESLTAREVLLQRIVNKSPSPPPIRRLDLVVFHPHYEGMMIPLLMVEFKAGHLDLEHWGQLVGYNYFVKSHSVALVNDKNIRFAYYDQHCRSYLYYNRTDFPLYRLLLKAAPCRLNIKGTFAFTPEQFPVTSEEEISTDLLDSVALS